MLCSSVTCAVHSANRTLRRSRRVSHTRPRREPIQSESSDPAWLLSVRGIGYIHRWRSRTGFHSRSRARGGLVRCTARTAHSLLCQPGTVSIAATAATWLLSVNCRSRRLHATHALKLPRATRLNLHSITVTPGDAAACSRMPTVISLTHSDLTHTVSLTYRSSLTRAVSLTCAVSHAHVVPLTHGT